MDKRLYKIDDNSIQNLKKIGFKYSETGIYTYEFPGYKWHGYTTIICRVTAFEDSKNVVIDVLNESLELYAPYYAENTNSNVLAIVKANIKREIQKLGIERVADE